MRPLPSKFYPDKSGVTLSCHRLHECFAYTDLPELNIVAKAIPSVHEVIPIHILVSEKSFLRWIYLQSIFDTVLIIFGYRSPTDEACKEIASKPGMSVVKIPKTDHLVRCRIICIAWIS